MLNESIICVPCAILWNAITFRFCVDPFSFSCTQCQHPLYFVHFFPLSFNRSFSLWMWLCSIWKWWKPKITCKKKRQRHRRLHIRAALFHCAFSIHKIFEKFCSAKHENEKSICYFVVWIVQYVLYGNVAPTHSLAHKLASENEKIFFSFSCTLFQ